MEQFLCPIKNKMISYEQCLAIQKSEKEDFCDGCKHFYVYQPTYLLYEKLIRKKDIQGKISYEREGDYIHWSFHQYLHLDITTDTYGYGYIEVNDGKLSVHPYVEEIFDNLIDIGLGNVIFVTKIGLTGRYISGMYPRALFEARKKRILFGIKPVAYSALGIEE